MSGGEHAWWKEAIVYQIYPRSFRDSNGDGVGDLRGLIDRLDYVASLGVTAVWLNPIYGSPNDDNGYDISDYRAIQPEYGTLADFDELLAGLHRRGLKLVMDLVVNHSSDEHPWFRAARSSRDNPYRDYYHWWPAERGTPPDRYSFFDVANDAWAYDAATDSYYLHYFSRKQPDLNWENPRLRAEVKDIMRYWLDRGVDGFRLDAFQYVGKDPAFPPLPPGYAENIVAAYGLRYRVHDYLRELRAGVMDHYDAFTVAEGAGSSFQDAVDLSAPGRRELDMVYHFEIADYVRPAEDGYDLVGLKALFTEWDRALAGRGWNSIYLGNHDVPRMVSKYGDDRPEHRAASAQCLNTLLLTLRGTPYTYFGDELGLANAGFTTIREYRDIEALNGYRRARARGEDQDAYLDRLARTSRDNARTPLPWTAGPAAGFTTGTPWIAVNADYRTVNVAAQEADPASCLHHFRRLTALRRAHPLLVYGDYEPLAEDHPQLFAYARRRGAARMLVAMNWSDRPARLALPEEFRNARRLVDNGRCAAPAGAGLELGPWGAAVLG